MIRLAQIGLPALRGPRDAEMLMAGAVFLDKGFSPWAILQAAAIEGANVRLFKAEWSEDLHPRDASNGRFVSAGGAAAVPASVAQQLIAGGAMQASAGVYALAGGALLSLTAAGWVLSHGPKGNIQDGPGYWLPGVSSNTASDGDGKDEAEKAPPQDPTDTAANKEQRPSKTPNSGYPGITFKNPGSGQVRIFGPDGKPLTDIDYDHDHGQGVPHQHDGVNGVRGSGKSIK